MSADATPTVVPEPVILFVRTISISLDVPVPTTPPFVMTPLTLFSVESLPFTNKILRRGIAVPLSVTKSVGTAGGGGPDEVLMNPAWLTNYSCMIYCVIRYTEPVPTEPLTINCVPAGRDGADALSPALLSS